MEEFSIEFDNEPLFNGPLTWFDTDYTLDELSKLPMEELKTIMRRWIDKNNKK